MLSKDEILKLWDAKIVPVHIPKLPDSIYVRTMTLPERFGFEEYAKKGPSGNRESADVMVSLVVYCACDADGKLLFTEADIPTLKQNSILTMRIFREATKLNGLTAADVRELEKNSGETQDEDSSSD